MQGSVVDLGPKRCVAPGAVVGVDVVIHPSRRALTARQQNAKLKRTRDTISLSLSPSLPPPQVSVSGADGLVQQVDSHGRALPLPGFLPHFSLSLSLSLSPFDQEEATILISRPNR